MKQINVTTKPKIMMFPRFWKNFFLRILNPELKMSGGKITSKKKVLLNPYTASRSARLGLFSLMA
jgi:hypothetical protein